jgi:hypothetical protein
MLQPAALAVELFPERANFAQAFGGFPSSYLL